MQLPPRLGIFLDCDGVIARVLEDKSAPALQRLRLDCLARLAGLVGMTGARVVVTSSWRTTFTVAQLNDLFRVAGHPVPVSGATPVIGDPTMMSAARGQEIQTWLDAHPGEVDRFVILDDWYGWCFGPLRERLVQTDTEEGLTDADVARAALLLGAASSTPAVEAA